MLIQPRPDTTFLLHLACRALLLAAVLLTLAACTTLPGRPPATEDPVTTASDGPEVPRWWYVRFRLRRGDAGEVDRFLDALIADQVLAPVIAHNEADIRLWRFHRRWARDAAGHQFSFIFFAPTPAADNVSRRIEQSPVLGALKAGGHVAEFHIQAADPDRATDPAATSDTSWPPEIQREWPKFIMGASRMWLGLVQAEAAKHGGLELYARYRAVEDGLDELWFSEANHAFFHHLSALFGYRPMRVIRHDIMTF